MPTYRVIAKKPTDKKYHAFDVKNKRQVEFATDTTIYHLDNDATEQEKVEFFSEKENEFKWLGRELNMEIKLQGINRS
jgi:hypothetical protein